MLPLVLTCGSTLRMTPVLYNWIVLTIGVLGLDRIVAVPVVIGTSSPTCRSAGWLSKATIEGEERTFTSVRLASALKIILGCDCGPNTRLNPGTALCSAAVAAVWAAAENKPTE